MSEIDVLVERLEKALNKLENASQFHQGSEKQDHAQAIMTKIELALSELHELEQQINQITEAEDNNA